MRSSRKSDILIMAGNLEAADERGTVPRDQRELIGRRRMVLVESGVWPAS